MRDIRHLTLPAFAAVISLARREIIRAKRVHYLKDIVNLFYGVIIIVVALKIPSNLSTAIRKLHICVEPSTRRDNISESRIAVLRTEKVNLGCVDYGFAVAVHKASSSLIYLPVVRWVEFLFALRSDAARFARSSNSTA
jgi:hypothetical protein